MPHPGVTERLKPRVKTTKYSCLEVLYRHVLRTHDRQSLPEQASRTFPFSTGRSVTVEPPESSRPFPGEFDHCLGSYEFDRPYVCTVDDAFVLEGSGICTTATRDVILETVNSRRDILERYLSASVPLPEALEFVGRHVATRATGRAPESDTRLDTACSMIRAPYPKSNENYSHWTQSFLTLLEGVEHYHERTGTRPTLVLEPDPPSWQLESLALLGYDREDIYVWDDDEQLGVDTLVVPSVRRREQDIHWHTNPRAGPNHYSSYKLVDPGGCEWLRRRALDGLGEASADIREGFDPSKKVFVSRADADERRIVNREEILDLLRPLGFEPYELSTLSVPEQVTLFAGADVVVATHGAGLANLAYASDCHVVELFGAKRKPTFYLMAQALDLEYELLLCEPVGDDLRVDPDPLLEAVGESDSIAGHPAPETD